MANGGRQVGNSDPATIIGDSSAIRELEPTELLEFYHQHEGTIGALAVISSIDPTDIRGLAKVSDRLQHHIPSDDPNVVIVINILSGNAGSYDKHIEGAINQDPIAKQLKSRKDDVPADAKTLRLRRSLIAIAHLDTLVDCSGYSEAR